MRTFLPIKGPGGRALTPNEKVALLVLGITLVLCVLTLLAGEGAYVDGEARNPVFGLVALLGGLLGAGILALYGIVMLWSGLIYFRGERIAKVAPLGGRLFAAFMVALGVSGALGIARLGTAGDLGLLVGRALGNTFGAGVGFPVLLLIMMLGIHLSSQGLWVAFREAATATAGLAPPVSSPGLGLGFAEAPRRRASAPPTLPDDGDPSADERTLAVTQAMEEIERSKVVTVVEVPQETDSADEERPSIGEEVEQVPPPAPDTEEAAILRGLRDVSEMLAPSGDLEVMDLAEVPVEPVQRPAPPAAEDPSEYEVENHGEVPVPAEAVDYPPPAPAAPPRREQTHFQWDAKADDPIEVMDIADVVSPEKPEVDSAPPASAEVGGAAGGIEPPAEEAAAEGDPYAQGGLLRRLPQHAEDPPTEEEKPYTTFDWRGRPLD